MNRRKLGRSDLHVSELCLGTRKFGWETREATAFDVLDGFVRVGGNFIQTCGVGAEDTHGIATIGVAEVYVGRWLKARGIPRDDIVIASRQDVSASDGRSDTFRTASSHSPELRRFAAAVAGALPRFARVRVVRRRADG